jgi:hypothetical protein
MAYSTDSDLLKIRSTIMSLGVDDWSDFHNLAKTAIDKDLEAKWYRTAALAAGYDWKYTPFDADLLLNSATQLKDLSCYKTLFLIYRYLAQDTTIDRDAYGQQRTYWAMVYDEELKSVIDRGLDYDWDESATIDTWEKSGKKQAWRIRRV